ncbi:hypothetical protein RUND412_008644, partial [Rhizina undulata]
MSLDSTKIFDAFVRKAVVKFLSKEHTLPKKGKATGASEETTDLLKVLDNPSFLNERRFLKGLNTPERNALLAASPVVQGAAPV